MPIINVVKPFGLRLGSDREVQHFSIGEHFVGDEELGHWFVQACLKEGRAMLVAEPVAETEEDDPEDSGEEQPPVGEEQEVPTAAEDAAETGEESDAPSREALMALTVAQLKEVAARCGLTLASNATKTVIVDALLASQRGE